MSGPVTTWGVVVDHALEPGERVTPEAVERWFAIGRAGYLEACPRLASFLERTHATLSASAVRVPEGIDVPDDRTVSIAVSVVEIRSSSFDMAVRFRWVAGGEPRSADGRCTVAIVDGAGAGVPVPVEVRDEFIAIQRAARAYA